MKKILTLVILGVFFLNACAPNAEDKGSGIEIHDPWTRSAAKGENGAVYLLIHNHSTSEDILTGASTVAADSAEFHLNEMDANSVMQMSPQVSIPLPGDSELEFKPGNYHIMLVNLYQDLNEGDKITVTLHLQIHEDIVVTVPVYDAANMGGGDMDMHTTPTP